MSDQEPSPPTKPTPRRRRKWPRRVALAALALLILIALLPTLASTAPGRLFIQGQINRRIAGKISIQAMSLGWLAGQKFQGIKLLDNQGKTVVTIATLDAPDLSLWSLLWGSRDLGRLTARIAGADIDTDNQGRVNLLTAVASAQQSAPVNGQGSTGSGPELWGGLRAKASITGDHIRFTSPQIPGGFPLDATLHKADIDLSNPRKTVGLNLDLQLEQAGLDVRMLIDAKAADLFDPAGQLSPTTLHLDGHASLLHASPAILDRLAGKPGRWAALLGNDVTAELTFSGKIQDLAAQFSAHSDTLLCDCKIQPAGNTLAIADGSTFHLTVTPEAWRAWEGDAATLKAPFTVALNLKKLSAEVSPQGGLDPRSTSLDATLGVMDSFELDSKNSAPVKVNGVAATFASAPLAQGAAIHLQATVEQGGGPGQIDLTTNLRNLFDSSGRLSFAHPAADMNGLISNLPMPAMDELLHTAGLLAEAVGPTLNLAVKTSLAQPAPDQTASGAWELSVKSARVNGQIAGSMTASQINVDKPGAFAVNIRPELLAMLQKPGPHSQPGENGQPIVLSKPTTFKLSIDQLHGSSLASLAIKAKASLEGAALAGRPGLGAVTLGETWLSLETPEFGKSFALKGHATAQSNGKSGAVDLDAAATRTATPLPDSPFWWGDPLAYADATLKLTSAGLPTAMLDQLTKMDGTLEATLGRTLDAKFVGQAATPTAGPSATLTLTSANLSAMAGLSVEGQAKSWNWSLSKDSHADLTLSPAAVAAWHKKLGDRWPGGLSLARPVKLSLTTAGAALPCLARGDACDWSRSSIAGLKFSVADAALTGEPAWEGATLSGLVAEVSSTRLSDIVKASLHANVRWKQGPPSSLDVAAGITGAATPNPGGDATIDLLSFPMQLADDYAEADGKMVALVGPLADRFQLKIVGLERDTAGSVSKVAMSATLQSNRATLDIPAGEYRRGKLLALTAPAKLTATITPEAYKVFFPQTDPPARGKPKGNDLLSTLLGSSDTTYRPPAPLELAAPAKLTATITRASAGFFSPEEGGDPDVYHANLAAAASVDSLTLRRTDGSASAQIDGMTLTLDSPNLARETALAIKAETLWQEKDAPPGAKGSIDSITNLKGLELDDDNKIDWGTVSLTTRTSAKGVATILVDQLMMQRGRLAVLLGPAISMEVTGSYPGNLEISANATNLDLAAKPTAGPDRMLRLREDAQAHLRITPETVRVLAVLNPEFLMLKSTKAPVSLVVRRSGFGAQLPTPGVPFDLSKTTAQIDATAGQATLTQGGTLQEIWSALRLAGVPGPQGDTIDVSFTPLHAELSKGVVTTNDLWIASGSYVVGTQGKVNILASPATADMTVGISGQTLSQVRELRNVPWNYVVEAPLRGPVSKLKLDAGKLTKSISLLAIEYAKPGVAGAISDLEALVNKKPKNAPQDKLLWSNQPRVAATQPDR